MQKGARKCAEIVLRVRMRRSLVPKRVIEFLIFLLLINLPWGFGGSHLPVLSICRPHKGDCGATRRKRDSALLHRLVGGKNPGLGLQRPGVLSWLCHCPAAWLEASLLTLKTSPAPFHSEILRFCPFPEVNLTVTKAEQQD